MTDYEKIKGIINDIDNLISQHVRSSEPAFEAWYTKAERFLTRKFGNTSLDSVYTRSSQGSEPNSDTTDMNSSQERSRILSIAGSNAPPSF